MEFRKVGNHVISKEVIGETIIEQVHDYIYHLAVLTDKKTIVADGIDTATITAGVYNYEKQYQVGFNDYINFEIDGIENQVLAADGKATITITSSTIGEIIVKTDNVSFRNGEVIINAI